MVAAANENGIDAHVADAHALTFEQAFDAVISNAALHWMLEPEAVLSSIHRALVPGGRFVAEFGGSGNAGKIVDVLKQALDTRNIPFTHPWYFPTAVEYAKLLEKHGFSIKYMNMFERLTPLPQPLSEWVLTFCQSFLSQASEKQKKEICEELHEALAPELFINGQWHVDYMRLRLKAIKL
jgi:SAM-dependent methyltransferase